MKPITFLSRLSRWFVFALLTSVVAGIVLATIFFVNFLRKEEIKRITLLSKSIRIQQEIKAPDPEVLDLLPDILNINNNVPLIVTDKNHNPILEEGYYRNIPKEILKDPQKLREKLRIMESNYKPFEIKFPDGNNQFVYYDNSRLLNNLRLTPYLVGLLILGYLLFTYWFMKTVKKTDEGYLWAGLAKETAHQIGTPLSSMIGWSEILREEIPDSVAVMEMNKDIYRLKTISERFSKIGSVPELNDFNINETLLQNFDYLKTRISGKINFKLHLPAHEILLPHNRILMSWVMENLVKNAVDAMKGTGNLDVTLQEKNKNIIIDFKDTGCGMTAKQARNVFNPGFSTKKRGWGLGLSLAKRVISEYHNGDIRVAHTEIGKGTTFRIILKNS